MAEVVMAVPVATSIYEPVELACWESNQATNDPGLVGSPVLGRAGLCKPLYVSLPLFILSFNVP